MSETKRVNQPGREEGVVRVGDQPIEHERPEDWGWHGETGKAGRIGAWFAVAALLTYLLGNHEGRMEDLWLIGSALVMVALSVRNTIRSSSTTEDDDITDPSSGAVSSTGTGARVIVQVTNWMFPILALAMLGLALALR